MVIHSDSFVFILLCFIAIQAIDGSDSKEEVCGSIDIRNTAKNLHKLENCTVIEGYLQIVLIDYGNIKDYENLTFPKLREITDYLFLFRAFGLTSLGKLFPNLTVIRGNTLFHNYALVIYEMLQLQQIGMKSLTEIVRGAVRIEKNPNLCFIETIDWDRIAKSAKNSHFIRENRPREECPICPVRPDCPVEHARTSDGKNIGDINGRLCWNTQTCQKRLCPDKCLRANRTCDDTGRVCCNEKCIGGCKIDSHGNSSCVSCRDFLYQNECVTKCPPTTFVYLNRRCITERECLNISNKSKQLNLKPFEGKCTPECPPGYTEDKNDPHKCDRCKGTCEKTCAGILISSIALAQSLKGCTKINGSLEISYQARGENVIKELEESFEHLSEIDGYLKISRSYPLISLSFLKNLKVIHGNKLERESYSLLVIDNPNLQDLWSMDDKTGFNKISVKKGKVFFHLNPKLCLDKIWALKNYADIPGMADKPQEWEDKDVSTYSNGEKVACNVSKLAVALLDVSSQLVMIQFTSFKKQMSDPRSLLGYLIYYREAEFQNVSIFEGRDACNTNLWKIDDYEVSAGEDDNIRHIIPGLKPFTQYALYVKTYTIASEKKGAQSDIIYFMTKADTPSQPRNIQARPLSFDKIVVEWEGPNKPNGNVTHYIVTGTKDTDSVEFDDERSCADRVTHDVKKEIPNETKKTDHWIKNMTVNGKGEECCSCKKVKPDDSEAEMRITFEDHLINSVYIKRDDEKSNLRDNNTIRTKRSIPSDSNSTNDDQFEKIVIGNEMRIEIHNLSHYAEFTIKVRACHDEHPGDVSKNTRPGTSEKKKDKCSLEAMTTVRTLPRGGTDDIDENTISITSDNSSLPNIVNVKWDEPQLPNGLIISYQIEYKKVTSNENTLRPVCITSLLYKEKYKENKGWPLTELSPGNYSLRLRANSLAGWGNWTKPKYFNVLDQSSSNYEVVIYIVIPVAILVSVSFVLLTGFVYYKYRKNQAKLDIISANPGYMPLSYETDPEWEVPRPDVRLGRELGQGSFGMVYEGEFDKDKDNLIKCAVKTVNDDASTQDRLNFINEAHVMKKFVDCNHVVKLLGMVSKEPPVFVLMELMTNGDLRSYLRVHRPDDEENPDAIPPTFQELLQMAIEIADGMSYLASRKFVHRDLAARNCMVAYDCTVKIGDFGMTRDVYETDYYKKGGKGLLPVRWMAPESLKDGIFTTYSDVWSYGVVLWEMATLACQPYQGLSNEDVLKYVVGGGIMEPPENCHIKLGSLMSQCWNRTPRHRPTFTQVIEMLLSDANDKFKDVSFYHKQKSQMQKQKSSSSSLETDPTSAPLMPLSNTVNIEDADEKEENVNFFPSVFDRAVPDSVDVVSDDHNVNHNDGHNDGHNVGHNDVNHDHNHRHCNDNDKDRGNSDGSKGSKISSTTSNGSIANGHAVHYHTTQC